MSYELPYAHHVGISQNCVYLSWQKQTQSLDQPRTSFDGKGTYLPKLAKRYHEECAVALDGARG